MMFDSSSASFVDFQAHRNKRLKELWDCGDHGKKATVNHTEELLDRVKQLETSYKLTNADMHNKSLFL